MSTQDQEISNNELNIALQRVKELQLKASAKNEVLPKVSDLPVLTEVFNGSSDDLTPLDKATAIANTEQSLNQVPLNQVPLNQVQVQKILDDMKPMIEAEAQKIIALELQKVEEHLTKNLEKNLLSSLNRYLTNAES